MTSSLRPASAADIPWLKLQLQSYLGELSAFATIEKNNSGQYHYPYFEHYWRAPDRHPYIIEEGGVESGFILAREELVPADGNQLMEVSELYILPSFRRGLMASRAITELVKMFPGSWRVCVLEKNLVAHAFWSNLIPTLDASFQESRPSRSTNHQFVFSFRV